MLWSSTMLVYPANLRSPSLPHRPRQIGHSPCPTASPVQRRMHVQQNKCPHSAAVGSFIGSRHSGHRRLPVGMYGRTVSSFKSTTGCSTVALSLDIGECLGPAGVAFSDKVGVGERIFSIRVVAGSESVLEEVSDRYDWVAICSNRRRPSSSYPGLCSPGNSRRVNIYLSTLSRIFGYITYSKYPFWEGVVCP